MIHWQGVAYCLSIRNGCYKNWPDFESHRKNAENVAVCHHKWQMSSVKMKQYSPIENLWQRLKRQTPKYLEVLDNLFTIHRKQQKYGGEGKTSLIYF